MPPALKLRSRILARAPYPGASNTVDINQPRKDWVTASFRAKPKPVGLIFNEKEVEYLQMDKSNLVKVKMKDGSIAYRQKPARAEPSLDLPMDPTFVPFLQRMEAAIRRNRALEARQARKAALAAADPDREPTPDPYCPPTRPVTPTWENSPGRDWQPAYPPTRPVTPNGTLLPPTRPVTPNGTLLPFPSDDAEPPTRPVTPNGTLLPFPTSPSPPNPRNPTPPSPKTKTISLTDLAAMGGISALPPNTTVRMSRTGISFEVEAPRARPAYEYECSPPHVEEEDEQTLDTPTPVSAPVSRVSAEDEQAPAVEMGSRFVEISQPQRAAVEQQHRDPAPEPAEESSPFVTTSTSTPVPAPVPAFTPESSMPSSFAVPEPNPFVGYTTAPPSAFFPAGSQTGSPSPFGVPASTFTFQTSVPYPSPFPAPQQHPPHLPASQYQYHPPPQHPCPHSYPHLPPTPTLPLPTGTDAQHQHLRHLIAQCTSPFQVVDLLHQLIASAALAVASASHMLGIFSEFAVQAQGQAQVQEPPPVSMSIVYGARGSGPAPRRADADAGVVPVPVVDQPAQEGWWAVHRRAHAHSHAHTEARRPGAVKEVRTRDKGAATRERQQARWLQSRGGADVEADAESEAEEEEEHEAMAYVGSRVREDFRRYMGATAATHPRHQRPSRAHTGRP